MLSVLIPVYNFDVLALVKELSSQAQRLEADTEIIVFDDASDEEWTIRNQELTDLKKVQYVVLPENAGRARIRNQLAEAAVHDYLLFLDCDSEIIKDDFLKSYLDFLPTDGILAGGRVYSENKPAEKAKTLHWLYGHKKESRSLAERKAEPAKYFHSNNFVVPRSLFLDIMFDESIEGYGYEDLALATSLRSKGIAVDHISNPVEHLGLEDADIFLSKTRQAIDNLVSIKKSGVDITTNLESFAGKVDLVKMRPIVKAYYKWNEKNIVANLLSDSPKLSNLDLYKLNYYFSLT